MTASQSSSDSSDSDTHGDKKFGQNQDDLNMSKSINIEWIADELQQEYLDSTMKKKYRWIMLMLCCLFVVPNYFCYDNPAAL